jgi:prolyl 4-hydroxylase
MKNFTELGFKKVRAPPALMELVEHFWLNNREHQTVEWTTISPYHNTWDSDPTVVKIEDTSMIGGGWPLRTAFANAVREVIEEWTGMKQVIASVYGIRSYHNQSILAPHVDRNPLISSAILNIAQDVEEDWPLEVYDHNGVAHNVTMLPGDLVLYESHSVVHGRPFPLNGNFYANMFIHFEPMGPLDATQHEPIFVDGLRYPPYLVRFNNRLFDEYILMPVDFIRN